MIWTLIMTILTTTNGCYATVFGYPGDMSAGGPAACTHKPILEHYEAKTVGIAHRTLKCGTKVKVTNLSTKRSVIATVVDRGPYGAGTPKYDWYVKRKENEPPPAKLCEKIGDLECLPRPWRGCVDLLPATAEAIGFKRRGLVTLEVVRKKK